MPYSAVHVILRSREKSGIYFKKTGLTLNPGMRAQVQATSQPWREQAARQLLTTSFIMDFEVTI